VSARADFRAAARAAMAGAGGRLAGWTDLPAWADRVDTDALPAFTISTAIERSDMRDKDTLNRRADLVVQVARTGGDDVQDEFDLDADAIEAVVHPALWAVPAALLVELRETEFTIRGEGERRLAWLVLTFSCEYETDLPV